MHMTIKDLCLYRRPLQACAFLICILLFSVVSSQDVSQEIENLLVRAESAPSMMKAKELYDLVLAKDPENIYGLSGIGYVMGSMGKNMEAAKYFERAASKPHPMQAQTAFNAAFAYQSANEPMKAIEMYERALKIDPSLVAARVKIAYLHLQSGQEEKAAGHLKEAIKVEPKRAELYFYLGDVLNNMKKWKDASEAYKEAIRLQPNNPMAYRHLGDSLSNRGLHSEALENYRTAYKYDKSVVSVVGILHEQRELCIWRNWPLILSKINEGVKAMLRDGSHSPLSPYQTLFLPLAPEFARDIAASWSERTIMTELNSTKSPAHVATNHLTSPSTFYRKFNKQVQAFESQLSLQVKAEEEVEKMRTFCKKELKKYISFSNKVGKYKMSEIPDGAFSTYLKRPLRIGYLSRRFERYPGTQLMLQMFGLHSRPDYQVYSYAYGPDDNSEERKVVRETSDVFRDVWTLAPADVASKIAQDQVDVLIDYDGGHNFNSLAVLAHRPAPVQITFLGFAGTSGAKGVIDYIVVDPIIAPPKLHIDSNLEDKAALDSLVTRYSLPARLHHLAVGNETSLVNFLTEAPLYLPYTYQPQDYRSEVGPTPTRASLGLPERSLEGTPSPNHPVLETNMTKLEEFISIDEPVVELSEDEKAMNTPRSTEGFVFVCFNRNNKYEPDSFSAWAAILRGTPGSVLWLLAAGDEVEANLRASALQYGVDPNRLKFANNEPKPKHLARSKQADLFIDTFFYTAHTTASDALYVGLPVLTVANQTFASRVSASIVLSAGLPELVADSQSDFVRRAIRLAKYPKELEALKKRLEILLDTHLPDRNKGNAIARANSASSQFPLFNTPFFVRSIESAVTTARLRYACSKFDSMLDDSSSQTTVSYPLIINPEYTGESNGEGGSQGKPAKDEL